MYPTKPLGQICKIITGNTPSTKFQDYYGGEILWAGPGDFGNFKVVSTTKKTISNIGLQEGKARLVKKGSVMLVAIGATIGKVGISGCDMTTNQQINSFEPNNELNSDYLYYFFRKIKTFFFEKASQTTLPILNKSQCGNIPIPLPPLTTQQKIVSKLDSSFANINNQIEKLKNNISNIEDLNKSVLEKVFSEKGNTIKKLTEVTNLIMGQSPTSDTYNKNGVGLPFYQGKKEFGETYPIPEVYCNSPKKIAEKGDILMSVRAPVGPTNLCNEKSCIGRGLAAIRPNLELIDLKYLLSYFKKYETEIASLGKGSTFSSITKSNLENLQIPLPPLDKQKEIVKYLDQVFEKNKVIKTKYEEQISKLEELKQSLLKDAFEGRLVENI